MVQELIAQWPEKSLKHKGFSYTYREAGTQNLPGLPLVFLHGIGSGSASWVYQFSALSPQVRMIAWDAPGYGGTDPLKIEQPHAKDYAEALQLFLEGLSLKKIHLVGHSLGALIAASFAVHYSKMVDHLLLANPATGYGGATPEERNDKLNQRLKMMNTLGPVGMSEKRSDKLLTSEATVEAKTLVQWNMAKLHSQGHNQAAKMLAYGDLLKDVAQIPHPIGVIWGQEDEITPPDKCKAVATTAGILGIEIPSVGHASYIENPQAFNECLMSFLGSKHGN